MDKLIALAALGFLILAGTEGDPTDVYTLEGDSVHLDVPGYEKLKFKTLEWISESRNIIMLQYNNSEIIFYEQEKVGFSKQNFSLILHNLAAADNGSYAAEIIDPNQQLRKVASYSLHVLAPAPTPIIQTIISPIINNTACFVTLKCSVAQGSEVSILWTSVDRVSGRTVTHNGSRVDFLLNTADVNSSFTCHTRNLISEGSAVVSNLTCHRECSDSCVTFPAPQLQTLLWSLALVILVSFITGVHV